MMRIGILGGGFIGHQHAKELRKLGADIVAIAEPMEERRSEFQQEFGAQRGYPQGLDLIEHEDVDAVSICSPNHLHRPQTIAALRRGMHVLCEKPMALNRCESAEMVRTARKAGKLLMMAFNQLFDPGILEMVRLGAEGFFGEIYHARTSQLRRAGSPADGRDWFIDRRKAGAGVSFDLGAHAFYRAWYAMGRPTPESANAVLHRKFVPGDVDDFATAVIRFTNGASMLLEASWVGPRADTGKRTMIMGTKGGASFWMEGKEFRIIRRIGQDFVDETRELDQSSYPNKYRHFLESVENGVECLCPGSDGHIVQCVLDALIESSQNGTSVKVGDVAT